MKILNHPPLGLPAQKPAQNSPTLLKDLGNNFTNMMEEVNQAQNEADKKMAEFATSPEKDLHGTMIAMEKAEISLKLMLQIRSKLTNAYHEITRMQF